LLEDAVGSLSGAFVEFAPATEEAGPPNSQEIYCASVGWRFNELLLLKEHFDLSQKISVLIVVVFFH
jgi:hypothetical protein